MKKEIVLRHAGGVGDALMYSSIIKAGTHVVSSIKIAEAAKVIENSQRDLNIAFVNELSLIFEEIGIDTQEVLDAASSKWNFLKFNPGLVGGHCLPVDPYYLSFFAKKNKLGLWSMDFQYPWDFRRKK